MTFEWTVVRGERREKRRIEEINAAEAQGKGYLGTAYGTDVCHCVFMAAKYCEDFDVRVRWYNTPREIDKRLAELRKTQPGFIRVVFYSEKQERR